MSVKIGDVFRIITTKGNVYFQCTHMKTGHGDAIRVLEGFFQKSLSEQEVCSLAQKPHQFVALLCPVNTGRHRKYYDRVGNCNIPEFAKNHPIFRSEQGDYNDYWMWDGEKEWGQDTLTDEEKRYPIISMWAYPLLKTRIEQEWRPEKEFE